MCIRPKILYTVLSTLRIKGVYTELIDKLKQIYNLTQHAYGYQINDTHSYLRIDKTKDIYLIYVISSDIPELNKYVEEIKDCTKLIENNKVYVLPMELHL